MTKLGFSMIVAGGLVLGAPAIAAEITGNDKEINIRARSECAFSGLNDHDGDPRDPGGHTQSYGTLVGTFGLIDPQDFDPNADFFQPIPGFACNPNRGNDLHAEE